MRKLRRFLVTIGISLLIVILAGIASTVEAAAAGPMYLGIVSLRNGGHGYKQTGSKVWKIAEYDSLTDKTADLNKTIYCIKGGPGFGSSDMATGGVPTISRYSQKFNLKDLSSIPSTYRKILPSGSNYNSLMWLLDNIYIMPRVGVDNTTERNAFLKEKITDDYLYELVTDDDIDAVQQLAIWYFTNPDASDKYHYEAANFTMNSIAGVDENYVAIADLPEYAGMDDEPNGWDREDAIDALFRYYITTAKAHSNYVSPNETTSPIEIVKNNATMKKIGSNYVAGPYKINEVLDVNYTIEATYTDTNGKIITPTLGVKNANGDIVATSKTIKELVGTEFYLMMPTSSNISGIKMAINSSYTSRTADYWSVADAPSTEQPVVIVDETPHNFSELVSIVVPKPFDLSLRKFITDINGKAITNRIPTVDTSKLASGEATTATYNHPKSPIRVTVGDTVTYTIRVYNEGDVDGFVNEITDYLPQQLEFLPEDSINKQYGWVADSSNSKVIRTTYLSNALGTNKIVAFNGTTLSYKDVKIKCKVVTTSPMPTKITNIAEISKFVDGNGNTVTDRDSEANNANVPTGTELENYKDAEINRGETYIPGQQDDDDFEKLILKEFDLSLRKFITDLNGIPVTNREPVVDVSKLVSGETTTATYNHPKTPIKVTVGDIVTYTIRVYNEGEIDGYVEEITDHLPEQLEFLADNAVNKNYGWKADSTNSKIIRTNYLSKESSVNNNIVAFNGTKLDYKDVKVVCKVIETTPMPTKITNIADISNFVNINGEKVTDRDSQENNVQIPSDLPGYKDDEIGKAYIPGQQDDDDFEKLMIKEFDFSLRKFITKLNDEDITNRIPKPDTTKLIAGTETTATYNHPKSPISVTIGDIVEYSIRVYNEGEVDGFVNEITDHLPEQLEFLADNETNKQYGWKVDSTNSKVIRTNYLSKANSETNKIPAFDGTALSYKEVKVACKIVSTTPMPTKITNIADISDFVNGNGEKITDRDSQANNVQMPSDLPGYKDDEIIKTYVPGQQDDDDFEKLKLKEFDLSLRKFITKINDENITSRIPVVDITELKNGTSTTATYEHPKTPIKVKIGDTIIYTIRVYNEGGVDGYAEEITDHLPAQLEFLADNETNKQYGWTVDSTNSKVIRTNYLSKVNSETNKIPAFDGTTLSYKEVKVACKVVLTDPMPTKVTNIADISDFVNGNGEKIKDRDSEEDNLQMPDDLPSYKDDEIGKEYVPGQQDDDDFEKVEPKPLEFDLSLRKFITKLNDEDITNRIPNLDITKLAAGTETTATYNHPKTPISVTIGDIVEYSIRVYNEGEMNGYVEEITDHLPEQLEFLADNETNKQYGWTVDSTNSKIIRTNYLSKATSENNKIPAFDGTTLSYKEVKVICKVVETTPMPTKITNIADITNFTDGNGKTVIDRDSEKNNVQIPDDLPGYKDDEIGKEYVPGQEDDDDFEKLIVKEFDLSLRKFITKVNNENITNRIPVVDLTGLKNGTSTTAVYEHPKAPIKLDIDDTIEYTIRVYNEGGVDGYAEEVTDHLPAQLEFLADNVTNKQYGWTVDGTNSKMIRTNYLSKANSENNKIAAFDGTTLSYKEVKVVCKVVETEPMPTKVTNIADISDFVNGNGEDIKDRDSEKNNVQIPEDLPGYKDDEIGKEYVPGQQDDDDFEKVEIKQHYFDLALRKFITKVNDGDITDRYPIFRKDSDGNYTYIHTKEPVLVATNDIVTYTIRVYNEGEIAGYAKQVKDDIPDGLEFLPEHDTNTEYRWIMLDKDGNETQNANNAVSIATDYLSKEQEQNAGDNLLEAFEPDNMQEPDYRDIKVAFKVTEPNSSDRVIINKAQISEDSDKSGKDVDDIDSTPDEWNEGEDDQDIEKIKVQEFDLALRKFITKVNDKEITDRYPEFSIDSNGNYTYTHTKEPILVTTNSIITYTIRVYNEGEIAGYAKQVKDDIPDGLEFLPENSTNTEYRWVMLDKDGNETQDVENAVSIATDYLSKEQEQNAGENLLEAFEPNNMQEPDYRDIKVAFKVIIQNSSDKIIINKAQISDDSDKDGNDVEDKDSTPDEWNEGEDDQDIEKVKVQEFDLALRKFINAVNTTPIKDREPQVDVTPIKDGTGTSAIYTHPKGPVLVSNGNVVTYTIRVYNEGEMDGYAQEVKDDIPEGLKFLTDHETNKEYRWIMLDKDGNETENVENAVSIATDYLSKEQEENAGDNLIKAFDPETDTLSYKDVKVAFEVIEPNTSDRVVINKAQISDDSDKDGNEVEDKDSTPDEWNEGEDDQDIEKIKVQYFDLSLRKWVTQAIVTIDGEEKIIDTGHTAEDDPEEVVKVDLKKSQIEDVIVKFRYKIRVKNEGNIAGYAKEVKDYIPVGLKFVAEDNPLWTKVDEQTIVTDQTKDTLLQPGETTEVEVILTWINNSENFGVMDNWAEISKDDNDFDSPDIDSTPDNNKHGEDDIDDAPVLLSVKTGQMAIYTTITMAVLMIITSGVALIKKFVL